MHPDLEFRRHVLNLTYERYLVADRAWLDASQDVRTWLPRRARSAIAVIGNPGSPIREIYERRDKALSQLVAVRLKLEEAKRRIEMRSFANRPQKVMLISYLAR